MFWKWFLLLLMVIVPGVPLAGSDDFSDQEVRNNLNTYMNSVFGKVNPTLATFEKYEGSDPGIEAELSLLECAKMFPEKAPEDNPRCGAWLRERYSNPDKAESFYYSRLRSFFQPNLAGLEIKKIERGIYCVKFPDLRGTGMVHLRIRHAEKRSLSDLGVVSILQINGAPIRQYLGLANEPKLQSAD